MKTLLVFAAFVLPAFFLQAQDVTKPSSAPKKEQAKEISVSRLPGTVTKYISVNLPGAKITKAMKQKRNPGAKYIVHISIKTKGHTLVFSKKGELVRLDGKKIVTAADQDR